MQVMPKPTGRAAVSYSAGKNRFKGESPKRAKHREESCSFHHVLLLCLFIERLSTGCFYGSSSKQMLKIRYNIHTHVQRVCVWVGFCVQNVCVWISLLPHRGLMHNHNSLWSWIWADMNKCLIEWAQPEFWCLMRLCGRLPELTNDSI